MAVREIVDRNAMDIQQYNKNQCILGIEGRANPRKGDIVVTREDGPKIRAAVNIVDKIIPPNPEEGTRKMAEFSTMMMKAKSNDYAIISAKKNRRVYPTINRSESQETYFQ